MTQLYLIAAAIIILLATRRIYQKNIELFLIILVIMNFEFFGLVKVIRFSSNLRLMIMPIILFIFVEMLMMKKKMTIGKYGGWAILFFVILINGVLISALDGQPIILGIKSVKFYTLFLVYFFIVNHEIDIDKFIKYIIILALVIAGLTGLQHLTYPHIDIFRFQGMEGTTRANRITIGSVLIAAAAVFSFANFLKKKGQYYLYVFIIIMAHMVIVAQTRMLIAGIVLTCILAYLIYNKFSFKAISIFILISLIIPLAIIPYVSLDELAMVQQTKTDFDTGGEAPSSYLGRLRTYEYYLKKLMEAPIFGIGFGHFFWSGEYILQRKGIHLSDVGIMGFTIKTGIVGLTWLLVGLMRFIIIIVKGKELSTVGTYILLGMITIATIDFFMFENIIFMFGLFVGLLANSENDLRESRINLR